MKRVLIVSSSFAPAMPANGHRARHLAWTLPTLGWDVEILVPSIELQNPQWLDSESAQFFPQNAVCHPVSASPGKWMHRVGATSMAWRALRPMYLRGCELLNTGRFDLVYVTTTVFNFFCLGRLWHKKFAIPYVLDFQDPWYRPKQVITSTDHRWKAAVSQQAARFLEAFAVAKAAGIIAVSPNYIAELEVRYPKAEAFRQRRTATIPFGVLSRDFESATPAELAPHRELFEIVYVGVGAEIMAKSFRRIAEGLSQLRRQNPTIFAHLKIRLSGTDGRWTQGRPKILEEVASAAGIGDLVEEDPRIISYSESVRRALAADGLLVLGVNDPAYMPSKLFLYAMTKKPLLACMHRRSQVNEYFQRFPDLGALIHFDAPPDEYSKDNEKLMQFLQDVVSRKICSRDDVAKQFSAQTLARRHIELFEAVLH